MLVSIEFRPDRLAGARRSGNEQVRHRGQVGDVRLAVDRLAERQRQLRRGALVGVGFEQLAQRDRFAVRVRDLDADGRLARNAIDEDRLRLHGQAEIVGEAGDLAVLHAGVRLELEGRDHRARVDLRHLAFDGELAALLFELSRRLHQLALVDLALGLWRVEQRRGRQRELSPALRRCFERLGLRQRQRRRLRALCAPRQADPADGPGRLVGDLRPRRPNRARPARVLVVRSPGSRRQSARPSSSAAPARSRRAALLAPHVEPLAHVTEAARRRVLQHHHGAREHPAERELRREDDRQHHQRQQDDDRAGAIEVVRRAASPSHAPIEPPAWNDLPATSVLPKTRLRNALEQANSSAAPVTFV